MPPSRIQGGGFLAEAADTERLIIGAGYSQPKRRHSQKRCDETGHGELLPSLGVLKGPKMAQQTQPLSSLGGQSKDRDSKEIISKT